jgi:hypothetical protein
MFSFPSSSQTLQQRTAKDARVANLDPEELAALSNGWESLGNSGRNERATSGSVAPLVVLLVEPEEGSPGHLLRNQHPRCKFRPSSRLETKWADREGPN